MGKTGAELNLRQCWMTPAVSASWCLRSSDSRCSACLQGDRIGSSDLHLILCRLKERFGKTVAFTSCGQTKEGEANGCSLFGGSSMPGSELLLLRRGLHYCHLGICVQSPVVTPCSSILAIRPCHCRPWFLQAP